MDKIPASKKIISNLFYYFLDFSVLIVLGYVFWILMGKFLIPEQYGILQTATSIFAVLVAITTLGFHEALIKFVPELVKKDKKPEADSMIRFSIKTVSIFSFIVSILIFVFSDRISFLIYNSQKLALPLKFLSLMIFTGTGFNILKFAMQGLHQYRKLFFYDLAGNIVRIIVAMLFLYLGFQAASGIVGWSFWYVTFALLSLGILRSNGKTGFDRRIFYNFAFLSTLSAISILFLFQGNILILSLLSSFEAVGFFGVAFIFGQFILFIPNIIMGTIFPSISEIWIENKEHVKSLISASIKFSVVTVMPLLILFSVFSEILIKIFYSDAYITAASAFPLVLSGSFLFGLAGILSITLYSIYKPKIRLLVLVFGATINILLSFLLIQTSGLSGATVAYFVSQLFVMLAFLYFTNKALKFSFSRRNLFFVPVILIFISILYLSLQTENIFLRALIALLDVAIYTVLISRLNVLNRDDLFILELFPDKYGFRFLKHLARKLIK